MFILACSVEETLTGDENSIKEFTYIWEGKLKENGGILILLTDKSLEEFLEKKETDNYKFIPWAEYLITSSGTEIHKWDKLTKQYILEKNWTQFLSENYNKEELVKGMNKFDEVVVPSVSEGDVLRHIITLQTLDQDPKLITKRLRRKYPQAQFNLKENVCWLQGCHLIEALPTGTSKASALEYVVDLIESEQSFHTQLPVYWCGSSNADIDLTESPYFGIICANSTYELKKHCIREKHYFCKQKFTKGILEGLRHYDILPYDWKEDAMKYTKKCVILASVAISTYFVVREIKKQISNFVSKE